MIIPFQMIQAIVVASEGALNAALAAAGSDYRVKAKENQDLGLRPGEYIMRTCGLILPEIERMNNEAMMELEKINQQKISER